MIHWAKYRKNIDPSGKLRLENFKSPGSDRIGSDRVALQNGKFW